MSQQQTDAIPTQYAETILNTVNSHASEETKLHAMYTYHFLGYSIREIARIYGKSPSTILEWIRNFDKSGNLARKQRETVSRKFTAHQVEWIIQFFNEKPLSFLDEAKSSFKSFWGRDISITSIWRIIHDAGLTWKAAERQSLKIQEDDIFRFVLELNSLDWTPSNLLFLDEVGFSNGDLVRKRGYALQGQRLCIRGEYGRLARVSLLCFLDVNGIVEAVQTEGTFTRSLFFEGCRRLASSGKISAYPGPRSIWILDGARIHCNADVVMYLRAVGIVPIFLPAYCPFFNPIEVIFGLMKRHAKRNYPDGSMTARAFPYFVTETVNAFRSYNAREIFKSCGYCGTRAFNVGAAYSSDVSQMGFE